jgi:hypothetical protein
MRTAEHQYNVVPVQDTGALNRIESRTVRNKNIKICSTRGTEVAETKHGWEEKKWRDGKSYLRAGKSSPLCRMAILASRLVQMETNRRAAGRPTVRIK